MKFINSKSFNQCDSTREDELEDDYLILDVTSMVAPHISESAALIINKV